jgi:hypothetical protein
MTYETILGGMCGTKNSIVGIPLMPLVSQITSSVISSLGQIISISSAFKIYLVFLVNRV